MPATALRMRLKLRESAGVPATLENASGCGFDESARATLADQFLKHRATRTTIASSTAAARDLAHRGRTLLNEKGYVAVSDSSAVTNDHARFVLRVLPLYGILKVIIKYLGAVFLGSPGSSTS